MNTPKALLNHLTPAQFLAEYWEKKPLLIKQAIPNFKGLLTPDELAGLACEADVQARIVTFKKGKWSAKHGPFDEDDFAKLPEKTTPENNWTLLVQSVNHFLPEAAALLQQFDFIPHARLDDLMVSYAPNGGGVGPHFDSYDVFLLQGQGKRLWRISEQTDLTLVEGAPLRILKQFDTAQEWLLEAGDMLYLPPHLAHWGIAVSDGAQDCMTYSIGFRAPKNQELATEFLGFLQDKLNQDALQIAGIYQDPDLTLQTHAAEISKEMISKVSANLEKLQWQKMLNDGALVGEFLGTYLSEPKSHVVFEKNKKISLAQFAEKIQLQGLALDFKSQMLFVNATFYLNGESFTCANASANLLKTLADKRECMPNNLQDDRLLMQLYAWYLAGFIHLKSA
ncbi:MAG TPA: cupin domain-containing protein [Methylotenera sp.]|nr:cupin domain-containing protein [Methylotenera sp.]HPH05540.1 cupin domain-containing protein [Methylotenera sp.]HPN00046.1 cupin domain-containing protein [Methylotenera sp.]